MRAVNGLHHITAIAGPAQENLDFYADAEGSPGSDLTFFPWSHMAPPRAGHGLAMEVGLEVPAGSLPYWADRLERYGTATGPRETRFGQQVMALTDPHGLSVALVEAGSERRFAPWDHGPVPVERQIRGLYGAQVWERDAAATAHFLTSVLGFHEQAAERGWTRYACAGGPGVIDLRDAPEARRGMWGVGAVHHLAWRVDDQEHQLAVRTRVEAAGAHPTSVIDRFWFTSVYFKEPGGVLFELATDGPGFGVDEDAAHLGERLVLPPWLEAHRATIEEALPPLSLESVAGER